MKKIICIVFITLISISAYAQKEIEKVWFNQEKTSKIQIFKATDGFYYGKIVWLQTPKDKEGNSITDRNNVDEKLRQAPLINLLILKKFKYTGNNIFEEGTVYDPVSGKTYCGKLTLQGKEIKLKGFICSASFLGRTSIWTLVEE